MNKKQYHIALLSFLIAALILITANAIYDFFQWFYVFLVLFIYYFYIKYKLSSPLQMFTKKFNLLVDYDLDVEQALILAQNQFDNAPTKMFKNLIQMYLGMALYYNAKYDEAIKTFNLIELNKVNQVYHSLIFAFSGYCAFELNDLVSLDNNIELIANLKDRVNKKYYKFVNDYEYVLRALRTYEEDPENYKDIIEKNFGRDDGYISTKLIYNYRLAYYYKTINDIEEMDKCLAKVIANGKNHYTAINARNMFQNTCNIEDYVFTEKEETVEDVEIIGEPKQLEELSEVEEVEVVEDKE